MASKIVDSTGKTVGTLISLLGGAALIELRVNHKSYIVTVYPDRIGDESGGILLYHTEPDCAGQTYVEYLDLFFAEYFLTPLGWISHSPDNVTPQTINTESKGETSSPSCTNESDTKNVITLEQATGPDFRSGFTPPFRFEL